MSYIKCSGCHTPEACDTSVPHDSEKPGMCWNAYALQRQAKPVLPPGTYTGRIVSAVEAGGALHTAIEVAGFKPVRTVTKLPPSAPRAPGQGSVTEQIFALCDSVLVELRAADPTKWGSPEALIEARKLAIPRLEAQGVNSNSARKGSSMWIAARR